MRALLQVFDIRAGVIAALLMGGIVWWINSDYGPLLATTAALKQGFYTFFMGGLITRFCQRLAQRRGPVGLALALAVVLPCIVTIGATFFVHSLRGTPKPIASTIPVAMISLPAFTGLALQSRKSAESLIEEGAEESSMDVESNEARRSEER